MSRTRKRLLRLLPLFAVAGFAAWLAFSPAAEGLRARLGLDDGDRGRLVLYGNVDIREVELAFRQPGRVATMAYDEGDAVKQGAVMAELDAEPYREALARAEAEKRRAEAELAKLQRGNRPEEIAQAEAAVAQAEATLENAERDYRRKAALLPEQAVSQATVDAAKSARDEASAALTAKRQALALARSGARIEDIDAAQAALAAAEAALEEARTALDDTTLAAPADGTVLARVREPGSMVDSARPIYTLALGAPVYVRAYAPEPALGRLAPGTKVTIRTDSGDTPYSGHVGFVSPRAEFTPKSVQTTELRTDLVYRLRIVVEDADTGLRQGMPVTVIVGPATATPDGGS